MITSLKVGQLPVNWWILWRDRDPVRKALVMAQTLHWVGILQAHLIKNSAQPNRPATWAAVAACLNRDVANIKRWKAGKQTRYAPSDFLALAGCVGLDVRELFPTNTQWVAGAFEVARDIFATDPQNVGPIIGAGVWANETGRHEQAGCKHDEVFFQNHG